MLELTDTQKVFQSGVFLQILMVPCSGITGEHTFSNKANTGGSMTEDLLLTGPQHHFPDPLDHGGLDAKDHLMRNNLPVVHKPQPLLVY